MAVRDLILRGLKNTLNIGYEITDGLGDLYIAPEAGAVPQSASRGPGISRVIFTRGTASIGVELPVTRSWAIPSSGQIGTATLSLPLGSAAASTTYIDPKGGSLVRVSGQNGCGDWLGIITAPRYTQQTVELTAYQPWVIFQHRFLRNGRTFIHTTPGYLFTQAWRDAASGINAVTLGHGPYETGGPHVESWQASGQDLWSAITSLMGMSEHELHIDATTLKAEWCGSYAYTSLYGSVLVAGGNFRNVSYVADGTSRAAEVLALDPTGRPPYRARMGETAAASHWPAQVQVNAALGGVNLRALADATLDKHSIPAVAVEGDLPIGQWDLRERQTVQMVIPWAEFSGVCVPGRVLQRTVNDNSGLMHIVVQVLNAPRVDAPLVTGGTPLRGAVQRIKRTARTTDRLARSHPSVRYKVPIHGVTDATGGHVDGILQPVNAIVPPGIVDTSGGNVNANVGDVGSAFDQTAINDNFAALTDRTNTMIQVHATDQATIRDNLADLAATVAGLKAEILAQRRG